MKILNVVCKTVLANNDNSKQLIYTLILVKPERVTQHQEVMTTLSNSLLSFPLQPILPNPNCTSLTVNNDPSLLNHPILSQIDQCNSAEQLKQIHARMLRTELFFNPYIASKLFTASAFSSFSSLDYARKVFDQIPEPNLYSWNTLIRAFGCFCR